LHALSGAEGQEVQALLDPANESNTTMSGDNPQTSAPVNTTHTTLTNICLGTRAEDDVAGAMEGQISGQGEDGEQSRTAGGGAGQHTTGTSKETTQEGHDIATADEGVQFPSVLTNDMLANNLANSGLGARAEDDAAVAMEGQISGQGEDGEQSRTAGGGAGQHTTGTRQPPGAMSSGDINAWIRARKSFKIRAPEMPRYKAGRGWAKVKDRTSTLGTPAAAAAQPTPELAGSKRQTPRQIRRESAWVRREQSRGSWDPPAHFREAPTRRYSGYQQPLPSRAGSQNVHAMLLGRKSPTGVPHWKGRST